MDEEIQISVESVKEDFGSRLEIAGDSRVFFSGKFGIGKTYFLKQFFNDENASYEAFHIFPVNYQIHNNEDIFELMKYDILVELLQKEGVTFDKKDFDSFIDLENLLYLWGKEHVTEVLSAGASLIPKLGRPIKEVIGLADNFIKYKNELEKGEKGKIEEFIRQMKDKDITETDALSELLKNKIKNLKGDRKSVLILDDLDRVDPEHIFRILNIFSAYFEKERENKFGFDIVIVVADYANIRHTYLHRYGEKADFSGYLDKFFTVSPYYFDNKRAVIDMVDRIVKQIKNENPDLDAAIGESGYIKLFLQHIFIKAVDAEIMNLRELLKATRYQLVELRKGGFRQGPFINEFHWILDIAIKIAIHSFSNLDDFVDKLRVLKAMRTPPEAEMPYRAFMPILLRSLSVEIPEGANSTVNWGEYSIQRVVNDDPESISVKEVNGKNEQLFYDLLIIYIQEKRFEKRGDFQYER
ncbi:MAG: hypothetical protein CMI56_02210 [Parcubacteria group bacterium]|nr:hypothetical protein [Parcubacteria group bacterium]